jgi:predicted permease
MLAGLIARMRSLASGITNDPDADMREARGLRWFDAMRISWLDIKLGARMIHRYPGLTLVAGVAIGVANALGAGVMGAVAMMRDPKIPLDEGDRIVGLQVWSTSFNAERRIAFDLATWKSELKMVRDLGAFRSAVRAVGANDGRAEPGRGAEMNASGFRIARVNPLLGRYLLDDDERPGAPLVVVLGHELWSARFGSDSAIVGKTVKIGGVPHIVVGVMPAGFAFPINFNMWLPLRLDPHIEPREGPVLYAFARLAPGATLEAASAEVAAIGERTAKLFPKTHERLRPRLMSFAQSWFELDSPETVLMQRAAQVAVTLLLVIICVNVAILVYARTATRQAEIAVRSALGASRGRIVAQLVGEAMVLAAIGGLVGQGLIALIASQVDAILVQTGAAAVVPFWTKIHVSAATVMSLIVLTLLATLIIGVVPALQVTGRRVQASLQRLVGGHASVSMGKMWTSLIIAEVAITVAILPPAVFMASESLKAVMTGPGFPAQEFLSAELAVNREQNEAGPREEDAAYTARATELRYEVIRRLRAEPNVAGVSFSADVPGSESSGQIEIEGATAKFESRAGNGFRSGRWTDNALRVRFARVDAAFFDAVSVTPIVGRTFRPSDVATTTTAAIVNRTFADSLLKGVNPIGAKFRELGTQGDAEEYRGPWQEIVGVVQDLPAHVDYERPQAVWYEVARNVEPATLAIHVRGTDPTTFAARLREITTSVDQGMFLRNVQPLDDVLWQTHLPLRLIATSLAAVAASVLVLSAAGLYALMSVIVTRRRREIGIRIALGADQRRVLTGIFSRVAIQIGAGIAFGLTIAAVMLQFTGGEMKGFDALFVLPAVGLFMLGVGVIAALGPARRGLAIQPSAVLKED